MSGKPLVMIVDDDEIARVIVREHLGDQYEIEDAESADACLNKLKSCTPDIFLLDVQMREKDGFALCECRPASTAIQSNTGPFYLGG